MWQIWGAWLEQGKKRGRYQCGTTYLRGGVHLLGSVHRQRDLTTLCARCCALHHHVLCGDSLELGEKQAWSPALPATAKLLVLFSCARDRTWTSQTPLQHLSPMPVPSKLTEHLSTRNILGAQELLLIPTQHSYGFTL